MIFTNAWPPWTTPLLVGAFALSAIPAGVTFGIPAAIATAAIGIIVVLAISYFRTQVTIACDNEGATVTTESQRHGTLMKRFRWADVESAQHSERKHTANDVERVVRVFTVKAKGETVLEVTSEMRDFAAVTEYVEEQLSRASHNYDEATA